VSRKKSLVGVIFSLRAVLLNRQIPNSIVGASPEGLMGWSESSHHDDPVFILLSAPDARRLPLKSPRRTEPDIRFSEGRNHEQVVQNRLE